MNALLVLDSDLIVGAHVQRDFKSRTVRSRTSSLYMLKITFPLCTKTILIVEKNLNLYRPDLNLHSRTIDTQDEH